MFDFKSFGSKGAISSDPTAKQGFDFNSFGTLITDTVQPPKESKINDFFTSAKTGANQILDFSKGVLSKTPQGMIFTAAKDTLGALKDLPSKIGFDINEGAKSFSQGFSKGTQAGDFQASKGLAKGSLGVAADVASTLYTPVGSVIGQLEKLTGMDKAIEWTANQIVEKSGIANQKWFQDYAINHPNAEQWFEKGLMLVMAGADKSKIEPAKIINELKTGTGEIKNQVIKVADDLKNEYEQNKQISQAEKGVWEAEKAKSITGQILQAEPSDLTSGQRGLQTLGYSGEKTYQDVLKSIDKKLSENKAAVDAELAKDPTPKKIQTLATPIKVGDSVVNHNFVLDALAQLKDFYEKTNNIVNLERIKQIEAKVDPIKGGGLTLLEVQNLAREHGQELNAFSPTTGQLSTGLTKQAAENVRKGLVETVRKMMPDETTRNLDKQSTDLLNVKSLIKDRETALQKFINSHKKLSIFNRLGQLTGQVLNWTTLGSIRGLFRGLLGSGKIESEFKMNPVELQKQLQSQLKELNALEKMTPKEAEARLNKLLEEKVKGPKEKVNEFLDQISPGLRLKSVTVQALEKELADATKQSALAEQAGNKAKVNNIQKRIEGLRKEIVNQRNREKGFSQGAVPETALLQEARKFKSAEEFVKAKANLMTGGKKEITVFEPLKTVQDPSDWRKGEWQQQGIYLTPDKKYAKTFAGKDGVITNAFADVKNTFKIKNKEVGEIYNWDTVNDALIERPEYYKYFIDKLKQQGFDSIASSDGKQLLVFDPKSIQTKSQLTDIWKKANNK